MKTPEKTKPSSAKSWVWGGILVIGLGALGVLAYTQLFSDPPKPWASKWKISRYLKQQTGHSKFAIDFKFPDAREMQISPPAPAGTNAAAVVTTAPSATDTNSLFAAQSQMNSILRQKFNAATTYRAMYELIGQQLWVADKLLASRNPVHRRVAISIARQALSDSLNITENSWLAGRICEAYLWANLDLATDTTWKAPFSLENMINECATVFQQSEESNRVVDSYKLMIDKTGGSPRADWARLQIAQVKEQQGELPDAIYYLKEIKATNNYLAAIRRIPSLEDRLKNKKK